MSTTPDPTAPGVPTRRYRPGDWFGVLGERAVVLLPPTEKHRVAALWELVDGGSGFDVTLDALIAGGLRELPGFVLVSTTDGQTQLVLRGAARADLVAGGETFTVEGSAASTWVERTVDAVEQLTLVVGEVDEVRDAGDAGTGAESAGDGPAYTVDGGLVRLSWLRESPAHQGDDESGAVPAYEREFPLAPAVETTAASPADVDTEPDAGPEPYASSPSASPSASEPAPAPLPVRSAEPPSWTPGPPAPLMPPPAPPAPPPVVTAAEVAPDLHDGLTVTGAWPPAPPAGPGIPGQPPAPDVTRAVARLEVTGGDVVDVDRAVVFGRAPEPRRFSPTEQPRLVTVRSPHLEVSSTHLEVRPGSGADHGSAVATDLGSTNGTVLVQAGLPPQDLVPGQTVQLLPGAVLDLGDGVLIRVSQPAR